MAATISSPWGKPGAWALDAEEHEAELQQQQKDLPDSAVPTEKLADFPSLSAAAATKTKKKKGQTFSLAEFTTYGPEKSSQPTRLTHEESLMLPTGPRQRSPEELDRNHLGGGFKSYGPNRYNSTGDDSSNRDNRWGSSRVSNRESNRELPPSRADEIDNWAAAKKSTGNGNGFGSGFDRRERGERGGFFDSQSKADEVDSWVSNKSNNNHTEPPKRFGVGFERRSSFDSLQSRDSPRDSDNWGKKKEEIGSVGERPRLVLQPRTVPLGEERKRESPVAVAKPKGSNPFGEARPREEVLAEKGKDWKEIEEKLESVKMKEVVSGAEKGERGERGRGSYGLGNRRAFEERSWRKNESVESVDAASAEPQSEEKPDNGDAAEN